MFATAVYGVLNLESRRLRLACAGHPPPLLYQTGNAGDSPRLSMLWCRCC